MTTATSYDSSWLQTNRPQPMYDKKIHKTLSKIFYSNPADNHNLFNEFKDLFLFKLKNMKNNQIHGLDSFTNCDIIIGCTQFIDDLYIRLGDKLMTLENDYKYHVRLNPNIKFYNLNNLEKNKELLISMPFPYYGDLHPDTNSILNKCYDLKIPVHLDCAWLGCCKDIIFDFSHPAIISMGMSLSKGLGLGGNRIGIRLTKNRLNDSISIMNDFNMNCQSLVHIGLEFLQTFELDYFWQKYGISYYQICKDFNLTPSKAIHLAINQNNNPVGIRPLLRFLSDH